MPPPFQEWTQILADSLLSISDTVAHFATLAYKKAKEASADPLAFSLSTLKAGAFVGIGIILILTVGNGLDPPLRSIAMGASFGIALTLVLFAGADLFTGHTMYGAHGVLTRLIGPADLGKLWAWTWVGNLLGSIALAGLFVLAGGGTILNHAHGDLLHATAAKKMTAGAVDLFARGMLCNWLVCLAIWSSARTSSDLAKCILIFWCLYAFIAVGFEHSVANMTLFSLALLSPHGPHVSISGAAHNLLWVTAGNIMSGAFIMGWGYWRIAGRPKNAVAHALW